MDPQLRAAIIDNIPSVFPFVERTGLRVLDVDRGYCKLTIPLEPNINHIGTMYAGAMFTLAEIPGGVLCLSAFDTTRYYPLLKDLGLQFVALATTDLTVEARWTEDDIARMTAEVEERGKAEYTLQTELKDAAGQVVATSLGHYQVRALPTS